MFHLVQCVEVVPVYVHACVQESNVRLRVSWNLVIMLNAGFGRQPGQCKVTISRNPVKKKGVCVCRSGLHIKSDTGNVTVTEKSEIV